MDLTKINQILDAESKTFKEGIQSVIDTAIDRRKDLKSEVAKIFGLDQNSGITEESFFAILDGFAEISGNLDAVLGQAGFDTKVAGAWLRKEDPPKENFRGPMLRMLAEVVFDYYADNRLFHDLHQVLEEWGGGELPKCAEIPLESTLVDLGVIKDIGNLHGGVRILNCIKNEGIVTLGELLCRKDHEMLRVPHFGRKSLNELKAYLNDRFGADLQDREASDPNLERFEVMARNRLSLQVFAGESLVTQWHEGEKKLEYADLDYHAFRNVLSEQKEEAVYVQIYAEPDLLKALEEAGITHRTQLATAPQSVLSRVCHGKTGWKAQLEDLLGSTIGYSNRRLSLGMSIPLFLDPKVEVYTS
jgi:hypothetical protein